MSRLNRRTNLIVSTSIFLFTFAVRLLFILETKDVAAFRTPNPGMDIDLHWQAASLILRGATTDQPCFELMMPSTPFYPYWLALWRSILGDSLLIHRMFHALLASVNAVLIFFVINTLVKRQRIAAVCAFFWAALPSLIYFDASLHKSAVEILVLLTLICTVLDLCPFPEKHYHLIKGLVIGTLLAALLLLQLNTFLYAILVLGYVALDRNISWTSKSQVILPAVLIVSFTVAFPHVRHRFCEPKHPWFLPTKGIHFYIGFQEGSRGVYRQIDGIKPWPYGHAFQSRLYAEAQTRRQMTPQQADWFFVKETLRFLAQNPWESARIAVAKAALFFNNYEVKGVDDLYYLKTQSKVLAWTPGGLGLLVLFSGLGVLRLLESHKYRSLLLFAGLLGAMLAGVILSFVSWRYRLHNVVPLIVLAGLGLDCAAAKLQHIVKPAIGFRQRLKHCGLPVLLLAVCAWLAYRPVLVDLQELFFKRAAYNDRLSQNAESLADKLKILAGTASQDPRLVAEKALILARLHRHTEAFELLQYTHDKRHYLFPYATYQYLIYLLWLGEYERAIVLLNEIEDKKSEFLPTILNGLKGAEKKAFTFFVLPGLM